MESSLIPMKEYLLEKRRPTPDCSEELNSAYVREEIFILPVVPVAPVEGTGTTGFLKDSYSSPSFLRASLASSHPCSAALRNHFTASFLSCLPQSPLK